MKKFKLNWLDIVIIAVFIAAAAYGVYRVAVVNIIAANREPAHFRVLLKNSEQREDIAKNLKVGDTVIEILTKKTLGKVVDLQIGPSETQVTAADGTMFTAPRPGMVSVTLVAEIAAFDSPNGGFTFDGGKTNCYVNRNLDAAVGNIGITFRIIGIDKINE